MHRFWNRYIQPIIETVRPHHLLEVGTGNGQNTGKILAYCRHAHAFAELVDSHPLQEVVDVVAKSDSSICALHLLKSSIAIPRLATPDITLINDNPNWATVYTVLDQLRIAARRNREDFPLVLLHHVSWPYARRDMYRNPSDLDPMEKHAYAYRGMLPGVSELVENGINGNHANAAHEGGPRNGVLTAVENFIDSSEMELSFHTLPFFDGLGILVPAVRMTAELTALIESFYTSESLTQACIDLDRDAARLRARATMAEHHLIRRTETLQRAQELIQAQALQLQQLKKLSDMEISNVVSIHQHPPSEIDEHREEVARPAQINKVT